MPNLLWGCGCCFYCCCRQAGIPLLLCFASREAKQRRRHLLSRPHAHTPTAAKALAHGFTVAKRSEPFAGAASLDARVDLLLLLLLLRLLVWSVAGQKKVKPQSLTSSLCVCETDAGSTNALARPVAAQERRRAVLGKPDLLTAPTTFSDEHTSKRPLRLFSLALKQNFGSALTLLRERKRPLSAAAQPASGRAAHSVSMCAAASFACVYIRQNNPSLLQPLCPCRSRRRLAFLRPTHPADHPCAPTTRDGGNRYV